MPEMRSHIGRCAGEKVPSLPRAKLRRIRFKPGRPVVNRVDRHRQEGDRTSAARGGGTPRSVNRWLQDNWFYKSYR